VPGLIVVEQLQAYLVTQGIGQLPSVDPSTTLPSVWLMPRQGAAMPRTNGGEWLETQTITLHDPNLTGPPGVEAWLEDTFVDIIVRSRNAGEGKLLHRTIAGLLHPVGVAPVGKRNWTMGGLHLLYSSIWRREQALPTVENGLTYDRVASYRFRCARSDLAT
jgi:hypothetical protein